MNISSYPTGNMHVGKGTVCETQLTTVINDWVEILDKGGQVDTFILDFEKAFDTPLHEFLKKQIIWLWHWRKDTQVDRFLSLLQNTRSCCKR